MLFRKRESQLSERIGSPEYQIKDLEQMKWMAHIDLQRGQPKACFLGGVVREISGPQGFWWGMRTRFLIVASCLGYEWRDV